MPPRIRLSREKKGKGVADSPSPIRDARATDSPLDDFDSIHRDAPRDSDNMTLSQLLLVADAHRMVRDECAGRVEVGSSYVSVRHPNTIAYPEKFFESAQAIAAHSHLRWPDLSREWIRRQEARIARGEFIGLSPRSFINNLSASGLGAPGLVREDVGAEPSASGPKKKKKSKKSRRKATEELPLEEIASLDETSEGLEARKKKGEYEGATSSADHGEAPAVGREGAAEGPFESNHSVAAPEDRLRKKKKKRSIEAEPRRSGAEAGLVEVVAGGGVSLETPPEGRKVSARGSDPVASERLIRDECAGRVEVGSSDVSGSSSEASSQASRPLRRASREVPFDQIDCRPTIYHPGGIFEELCPLPPELLRDPRDHHLRWPDLSREWIRHQEARIARVDWESRLPVVLGPRAPGLVNEEVGAEPSASGPKKKKKSKKSRGKATEELPLEEIASLDETSEGLEARKEKGGKKRPYEGATSSADHGEAPAVGREGAPEGPFESNHSEAAPEDRPRKKKKKRSIEAEPRPSDAEAGLVEVVTGGGVSLETPPKERKVSARGSDPVASERSVPDPSASKGSRSEGSTVRRGKIEFPVRVEFSYNETTPLILNPLR
ncbi:hypothetical protein F2Q69_00020217 [Brassica cretica]|uniref:Uncharacterized protein n=1 Tax=Brassica cretica TaxID=69181 RepID=A0A8S9QCX5_BRACR|nr:hypothetical protein F2Q69_00020217 [Brassica cretica]